MGYFSNGAEGDDYQARYCSKCAHWDDEYGCPCLIAHELWNYEECNKEDSILNKMIPMEDGQNKECEFFTAPEIIYRALKELLNKEKG